MESDASSYILPDGGNVMIGISLWAQTLNIIWDVATEAEHQNGGLKEHDIPVLQARLDEILGRRGLPLANLRITPEYDLFAEPSRRALA